jgi:hypothetical protein
MLLSTPFQERVSNFAINVLLLQNASIIEQNMGIKILESGRLAKPEELLMNEAILNSVFHLPYLPPTSVQCVSESWKKKFPIFLARA